MKLKETQTMSGEVCYMRQKVWLLSALIIISLVIVPVQGNIHLAQSGGLILDPIDIKVTMNLDGTTTINVRARAINLGLSTITSLSFRIESLDAELLESKVNGTISASSAILQDRYTQVDVPLPTPLEENDSVWVELELEATDLQDDPEIGFDTTRYIEHFVFYIRPMNEYANLTFTAVLPRDALLSRESVVPLFPAADSNYTDGESLAFIWFTDSLQVGNEQAYVIEYQYPNLQTGTSSSFLFESIIIALLGIAFGIVLTLGGPKFYHRLRRIGAVRFVGVTTEEEEVLEVIRAKGGSCPQKDLYTEFDMSQAKVSLILNNLEERGLVRRFREGRENVVHIMED
jgi:uncharacterized membrane protein